MEATGTAWRVKCAVAVLLLVGVAGCGGAREPASEATPPGSTSEALSSAPPDFVVTRVSEPVGPNGPVGIPSGSSFRVNVTVCNRGGTTGGTALELYLSQDTSIVPGQDPSVGTLSPGASLVPGECAVREVVATANVPTGAWYVGAVADSTNQVAELNETNNALAGGLVGVGSRADFIVSQVSAPSVLKLGQAFTANVTVCNVGTVTDSTTVNLLMSSDAVITETDRVLVSGYSVGTLAAGQCVSRSVQTSAQVTTQGAWYLGAFVDQVKSRVELIESNNTRAGTLIGVGTRPDFVVTSMTGAPRVAQRNEPFPVTVQVCNQGNYPGSTSVELYLSPDVLITREQDFFSGGAYVGSLNPGVCGSVVVPFKGVPPADGEFFLGAIVDVGNSVAELIESNNAYTGGRLGLGSRPDFTITKVTGPSYVALGSSFDASVTVCNQGNAPGSAPVEIVFSKDAVIVPPAPVLGEGDISALRTGVSGLSPGLCTTLAVKLQASFPFSQPDGEYRLGAVVDPSSAVVELFESNNAYAGTVMGIGSGPDLVVQSVSASASVVGGASFEVAATVCNRGTLVSVGTDLGVVLSTDTEILPVGPPSQNGDVFVQGGWVNPLLPGQCSPMRLSARANVPEGAWYVGVAIDPANKQWELIESNNTAVSIPMGVGSRPDFVVTKVQVPPSYRPGEPFGASVTVCNRGTTGEATDVTLLLSPDEIFTAPTQDGMGDLFVGESTVGVLAAGACQTVQLQGFISLGEGAYFLGAVTDLKNNRPELIETNNARSAGLMGIGSKPDFLVTALTGPATARPGDRFAATLQVCNQGTESSSTDVALLLSQNEVPTVPGSPGSDGDAFIGQFPTPYLSRGQCSTMSVETTLPWGGGPVRELRLAAIVDPQQTKLELIESNNAYLGGVIGVGVEPDFVITEVKSVPSVPRGSSFEVSFTVCNQGFSPGSTDILVMRSPDAVITVPQPGGSAPDEVLGSLSAVSLSPGRCSTRNVQAYASAGLVTGTHYLGVVADPGGTTVELLESNNTRLGGPIGIGSGPDFLVTQVEAPVSAVPGGPLGVSATVCNQGTTSGSPVVSFFVSRDAVLEAPGIPPLGYRLVHTMSVGDLARGQCLPVTAQPSAPLEEGTWYVGALVAGSSTAAPELVASNNASVGGVVGVGYKPDFIVTKVEGPVVPRLDEPLRVSATVCNQGTTSGPAFVDLLLSREPLSSLPYYSSGTQYPVGSATLNPLQPGRCTSVSVEGSPSMVQGPWYLVGAVYGAEELFDDNNVRTGGVMGLGLGPDLVVTKVTGLKNVLPGEPLQLSATVCNQGNDGTGSTEVTLVLSSDTVISGPWSSISDDVFLGSAPTGPLEPGRCSTVPVPQTSLPYLQDVRWYLGAIVDASGYTVELIESNNTHVEGQLGVGHGPDFVITEVTGPARAYPGEQVSLSATVCNQGTTEGSTLLSIGLSSAGSSPSPSSGVLWLTETYVGSLQPGQCATQPFSASLYGSDGEGEYHLVAMADPSDYAWELVESNNLREGGVLGLGYGPDFVITEVTGPASVRPGELFEASATVCNQGLMAGDLEVAFYLSTDALIVPPGEPFAEWDYEYTRAFGGLLGPGQCTTVRRSLPGMTLHDGPHYLGAAVDPSRLQVEPLESNNTRVGPRLGVGFRPDFVVTQVTGPASMQRGASISASATVCNQGTEPGGTEVLLLLSPDEVLTPPGPYVQGDEALGSAFTGPLSPGQCATVPVQAQVPFLPGATFLLGAFSDPGRSSPELYEDNNGRVGTPVVVQP